MYTGGTCVVGTQCVLLMHQLHANSHGQILESLSYWQVGVLMCQVDLSASVVFLNCVLKLGMPDVALKFRRDIFNASFMVTGNPPDLASFLSFLPCPAVLCRVFSFPTKGAFVVRCRCYMVQNLVPWSLPLQFLQMTLLQHLFVE